MAVTVTNTQMVINDDTAITDNAATADTADATEVFTLTPDKADNKYLIVIDVGPTNGAVSYSVAAGDFWAAGSALTGSVAQATKAGIVLESAKYLQSDGTIAITFTPASGERLKTDHVLKVRAIQMI